MLIRLLGNESESGIVLAEAQKEAIHASLKYGVFVLTGGPGTGKTTVIKGFWQCWKSWLSGYSWRPPTGRGRQKVGRFIRASCGDST